MLDEDIQDPAEADFEDLDESLIQIAENALEQGFTNSEILGEFAKNPQSYPTPPQIPPAVLLAALIQNPEDNKSIEAFHPGSQNLGQPVWKFMKKGRLAKCKTRLVVRGDQHIESDLTGTYVVTRAARSSHVWPYMDCEVLQFSDNAS